MKKAISPKSRAVKKSSRFIIVGLGNPGLEYERTRHNSGRRAVEELRARGSFEPWHEDRTLQALCATGEIAGVGATLLLPQQFMNRSGSSLTRALKDPREVKRLIVVYDDLDLPLGSIKISFGRSSGGHKGLESVIRALKTRDFTRVRVGIAPRAQPVRSKALRGVRDTSRKPSNEQAILNFLLGVLPKREGALLTMALKRACEAIEAVIADGRERAMSIFNTTASTHESTSKEAKPSTVIRL